MPKTQTSTGRVAADILDSIDEVRRFLRGEKTGIKVYPPKASAAATTVDALKRVRLAAGLSVEVVAEKAGLTVAQLNRLEGGKVKTPSVELLERYAGAVGRKLRLSVVSPAK